MKYESSITYHSKDMANVKVFADRQTDEQAKNYMHPIFRYGGIKNKLKKSIHIFIAEICSVHIYWVYKKDVFLVYTCYKHITLLQLIR
jgi:hypothetical protein